MEDNNEDQITMSYFVGEEDKIRILGDEFVTKNKNYCKLIINEKERELTTHLAKKILQLIIK